MRVLHIIDALGAGGTQTILRDLSLATEWEATGTDHEIVVLHADGAQVWPELPRHVRILFLASGRRQLMAISWRLFRRLHQHDYDLIHLHLEVSTVLGAFIARAVARKPVVVTVYTGSVQMSSLRYRFLQLVRPLVDRYVAIFDFMVGELAQIGIPPGQIRVIPVGLDFTGATRLSRDAARQLLCVEAGIAQDRKILVTVARLQPDRATVRIVEAMARIAERKPETVLVVVGDGSERARAETRVAELGLQNHVRILGTRPDPWPYYLACDIYVAEVHAAALGAAPLQAMAAGCPVVGLSHNPLSAPVVRVQEQGIFDLADNENSLAEAIAKLLDSPQEMDNLGRAAHDCVLRTSSIAASVHQYHVLYDELIAERGR